MSYKKLFPHAMISLLKHQDKSETSLVIYTLDKEIGESDIRDEVLKELHLDNSAKVKIIDIHRKQLLSRYFTDHLKDMFKVSEHIVEGVTFKLFAVALVYIDDIENDNIDYLEPIEKIKKEEIRDFFQKRLQKY